MNKRALSACTNYLLYAIFIKAGKWHISWLIGKKSTHFNMTLEIFFKRSKGLVNGRKYIGSSQICKCKKELGGRVKERGEKEKGGREGERWKDISNITY